MATQIDAAAEADESPRHAFGSRSSGDLETIDRVVLVLGVVAAIALRLWLVRTRLGQLNSDEAVVGLMAERLAQHGELRVFFWGQNYGGTIESIVTAAVFRVFGTSIVALKLVPVAFDAVAAGLVYRIGRRMTSTRVAAYAAVAFLCGPGGIVWLSTSTRGFYWSTLVLGLACVLCSLRLLEDPHSTRDWIVLGLVSGLGFWQSPQILYFVVPSAVVLIVRLRSELRGVWIAALAAIVGAAPWLRVNVFGSWMSSLNAAALGQPHTTYAHRLHVFATEGIGVTLGVHYKDHWRGPFFTSIVAITLILVVFAVVARPPWRNRALLVVALVTYPFLFAIFPSSWTVGEGRYVLFLWPFMALALMYVARWRALQIALLVVVTLLSVASLRTQESNLLYEPDKPVPLHNAALRARLTELGVRDAFANYWIAYPITFQTHERIIVVPFLASRFATYDRRVRADPRPAWILLTGSRATTRFENALRTRNIQYRHEVVGPFVIDLPNTQVTPEEFDLGKVFG